MIHWKEIDFNDFIFTYVHNNKGVKYCNDIFTFDIETSTAFFIKGKWRPFFYSITDSTVYNDCKKASWCYIWQFGINEEVVYGRALEEFKIFLDSFLEFMNCNIIIYIHNASYEFQFLRNIFTPINVFARKKLHPMKFDYGEKCTFKCSYMLSRLSLKDIGEKLNCKYKKKVGNLNYHKLRTPISQLTKKELEYCEFDCLVMYEYLLNERKKYRNNILQIPLTQTGKVRKEVYKTFRNDWEYINYCQSLTPSVNEFLVLREAFLGGLTRSNATWTGRLLVNVHSRDETSAYPYCMLAFEYPCTHFMLRKNFTLDDVKKDECYIVNITFYNIRSKCFLTYIPSSKCICDKKALHDNGRVRKADELIMTITDVDFEIIKKTYNYDSFIINEIYTAKKKYLNNKYRKLVLTFFEQKNKLKNVQGMESIYMSEKEKLNALYGYMVTNLIMPDVIFTDKWEECEKLTEKQVNDALKKQRKSNKNMTVYSNGVYVTAYARKLLVDACLAVGDDTIYLDTDSNKFIGNHDEWFEEYNLTVIETLKKALPKELFDMCSTDGINYIGQFTKENDYLQFITYGAKKYGYKYYDKKSCKEKIGLTVSGLGKKACESLKKLEDFKLSTVFDYKHSGRTEMEHIDNQPSLEINGYKINYKYGIVARPSTYTLNMSKDYKLYLEECECEHENVEYLNSRKKFYSL